MRDFWMKSKNLKWNFEKMKTLMKKLKKQLEIVKQVKTCGCGCIDSKPYVVWGNHPLFARYDERFYDKEIALFAATLLRSRNYETVVWSNKDNRVIF